VYHSQDGTHWHAVPLGTDADPLGTDADPLQSADVAHGAGRFVIAGMRNAGTVVLDSADGETWREQPLNGAAGGLAAPIIRHVHDRFFLMNISFWTSSDGNSWAEPEHDYPYALFSDVIYGMAATWACPVLRCRPMPVDGERLTSIAMRYRRPASGSRCMVSYWRMASTWGCLPAARFTSPGAASRTGSFVHRTERPGSTRPDLIRMHTWAGTSSK
jgi:hypothetical protein